MPNLPSVLPSASRVSPTGSLGRSNIKASSSVFNQNGQSAKDKAVTSVNALGRKKTAPSSSIFDDHCEAKTSIFSRPTGAVTSINRPVTEKSATEADDLRYNYVRRLIKARQDKEQKEAAKKGMVINKEGKMVPAKTPGKLEMHLGTGASFHRGLRGGLDKTLKKMIRQNRFTMRNISATDRKMLGDIISKHAATRATGAGYGWSDKKRMKNEIQQLYDSKQISKVDMQDFKEIIEQLE